ncbi:GIY-YIG nuclease family protein [Crocosphaera sp.]|uniref:GIY-YIG nuclease family protein n=1 Tax=Crocosphaera sp. TaxID=2729996 RepID=UPI00263A29A7|nr:GIY-YIG nuclease family protein [Crocosphaera sp.]MDJ0579368.1 GIY-YIG nuclease family protein [Crocosphaera sp.]
MSAKFSQEMIAECQKSSGWIYLIQAEGTEKYKIGRSQNPHQRLQYLQTSSPILLKLVFTQWTINCFALEKALHEIYKEKRLHGEWFHLSEHIRYFITTEIKTMLYFHEDVSFFPGELINEFYTTKLAEKWEDSHIILNEESNHPQFSWIRFLYEEVMECFCLLFTEYLFGSNIQLVETYALQFNFLASYAVHELATDIIADKLNSNKLPDIDFRRTSMDIIDKHWSRKLLEETYSKIYKIYITGTNF